LSSLRPTADITSSTEARASRDSAPESFSSARLAGDDDRLPGRRRRALDLRRQDLDFVAVLDLRGERRDLAVDLAADRGIADVGMHGIGKIDRRRAARQRNELAVRRKAEHLIVEQFELGVLEEFLRIGAFGQQLDGPAQPGIGARLA